MYYYVDRDSDAGKFDCHLEPKSSCLRPPESSAELITNVPLGFMYPTVEGHAVPKDQLYLPLTRQR